MIKTKAISLAIIVAIAISMFAIVPNETVNAKKSKPVIVITNATYSKKNKKTTIRYTINKKLSKKYYLESDIAIPVSCYGNHIGHKKPGKYKDVVKGKISKSRKKEACALIYIYKNKKCVYSDAHAIKFVK